MAILQTLTGLGIFLFGFLSLLIWLFLYFDDGGRLQSRVQDLLTECWSAAESCQTQALRYETVVLRWVMQITSRMFNYLFGERLISIRSLSVSTCLSVASFGVTLLAGVSFLKDYQHFVLPFLVFTAVFVFAGLARPSWLSTIGASIVFVFVFLSFALILLAPEAKVFQISQPDLGTIVARSMMNDAAIAEDVEWFRGASDAELLSEGFLEVEIEKLRSLSDEELRIEFGFTEEDVRELAGAFEDTMVDEVVQDPRYKPFGLLGRIAVASILLLPLLAAITSDVVVIYLTRRFLDFSKETAASARIVATGLACVALAALLFWLPLVVGVNSRSRFGFNISLGLIAFMNWSVVLVACSSFLVGGLLVLHRMCWSSTVGYLDSISTAKKDSLRKACLVVGVAALGSGAEIMGDHWISSWIPS